MKRSKKISVQALLEHSFKPLERSKEGLLLGGFAEIATYGGNNCQCDGNNCNCYGGSDNCDCDTAHNQRGNNCQCKGTNTTATTKPTQIVPTTCGLFF